MHSISFGPAGGSVKSEQLFKSSISSTVSLMTLFLAASKTDYLAASLLAYS